MDLRADDNGVWLHGGKPRGKYHVECDPVTSELNVVQLESTPEFQRRISYAIDDDGQTIQYAVLQYLFKGSSCGYPSSRKCKKLNLQHV